MQQNLKADLIQKFNTEKYYAEQELVRLATPATSGDIPYKIKLELIDEQFEIIAHNNFKIALANQYFQVPEQQAKTSVPENKQQSETIHAGQTHGE